jgi:hypothetical protein
MKSRGKISIDISIGLLLILPNPQEEITNAR